MKKRKRLPTKEELEAAVDPIADEVADIERQQAEKEEADRKAALDRAMRNAIGPTGEHPAGKLSPQDEGGLVFSMRVYEGRLVLDFGKAVRSIGFTRSTLDQLIPVMTKHRDSLPYIFNSAKKVGGDDASKS